MLRSMRGCSRWRLLALGLVMSAQACAGEDTPATTGAAASQVAVSGGGVTIDVVTTNVWSGGFNGAVRITNTGFPSPITSFEIVFQLGGSASISGTSWNGNISAPDAGGARTATQPSWLSSQPITAGTTWDVGFPGAGTFVSSTVISVRINGQAIAIGGGGGGGGDTTPPTVALGSSATSVTSAGTITLSATAADNVGVVRVEFRDGATLLTTDSSPPFSASVGLSSINNGTHAYTARAFDAAGNATTSAPVAVTVNIPTGGGGGAGYTAVGGRLFKDGSEIKLFGLNWFGLETSNHVLHGLWTGRPLADFLADIKSKGFNALRFPVSPETINPGFPITGGPGIGEDFTALGGKDGRTALEYALAKAQAAGMFVLVDFHTCNPAQLGAGLPGGPISCSGYSLDRWLADLRTLATLSKTFTNMVGIDLTNEPHDLTWSAWSSLASQGGQAVLAVNPNLTIWVEGVANASPSGGLGANWGQNLFEAAAIPGIPADRLVFSPHSYGPSVAAQSYFSDPSYPANMPGVWDTLYGHLVGQGFTVVPGEFGGHYTTSSTPAQNDKLWQDSYVTYLINKGTRSSFYWCLNPNSGDTGGVLLDDWQTWNNDKLLLLQRLMQ
ncbi:MAG TPA: cellulase family glycosylhydrolase [Kofleriaceae bacterium]|nr:cellulase family glycosylhydrolase [Kofleriaceae bacterium]